MTESIYATIETPWGRVHVTGLSLSSDGFVSMSGEMVGLEFDSFPVNCACGHHLNYHNGMSADLAGARLAEPYCVVCDCSEFTLET